MPRPPRRRNPPVVRRWGELRRRGSGDGLCGWWLLSRDRCRPQLQSVARRRGRGFRCIAPRDEGWYARGSYCRCPGPRMNMASRALRHPEQRAGVSASSWVPASSCSAAPVRRVEAGDNLLWKTPAPASPSRTRRFRAVAPEVAERAHFSVSAEQERESSSRVKDGRATRGRRGSQPEGPETTTCHPTPRFHPGMNRPARPCHQRAPSLPGWNRRPSKRQGGGWGPIRCIYSRVFCPGREGSSE